MFTFFLLLLTAGFIALFYQFFKRVHAVHKVFDQAQKQQQEAQEQARREQQRHRHEARYRQGPYDPATGRRKVYRSDEGEYTDFEEIIEPQAPRRPARRVVDAESDTITDVEFEEIE